MYVIVEYELKEKKKNAGVAETLFCNHKRQHV